MVVEAAALVSGIHWARQEGIPPNLERHLRAAHGQTPSTNSPHPEALQQQVQESSETTQNPRSLAAVSVSVKALLIQDTARVSVTQLFVNNSGSRIPRASYTFPLPYSCTVIGFTCQVGRDRVLNGKVKPREEARASFEEATARDETAGLLDQHTTEVFTTTLGNIPRNARVKAEISFLSIIDYKFGDGHGLATFTLPTYIAPRYGNSPATLPQEESPLGNVRGLNVQIDILAAEEITTISSPSHIVSIEMGVGDRVWQTWRDFIESGGRENPRCAIVRLDDAVSNLDRDFIVTIQTLPQQGIEMPSACVEQHPSFNNHRAVMLTIPERFMERSPTEVHSAEIVFVADRSGSMSDKIDAVKSAMNFFLRGIPQRKHFNIWSFGSGYESLWRSSIPYSESTLQEALAYVSRHFQADMGGTELLPVLNAVASRASNFQTTDIVVLTDGQVWDLHGTLEFVRRTRLMTEGRVRVFSLGIGDAVSHALVEGMAKAGGGYAEVISSVSQTGLESSVVTVLQAALTGHIGPIWLEIDEPAQQTGMYGCMVPCPLVKSFRLFGRLLSQPKS
jgi:Mg-chelatase subunit ChlD